MALGSFADKGGYQVDPDFIKRWKAAQGRQPRSVTTLPKVSGQGRVPKAPPAPRAPAVPTAHTNPVTQAAAAATTGGSKLVDDAQAAAARAQGIFDETQKQSAIQTASAYDATDLAEAIRRLNTARPQEENAARNAENAAGLASSSTAVNQLGDIARNYTRQEGDLNDRYARAEAERAQQAADLASQRTLNETAIDQALAERQYQRDQEAALLNALAKPAAVGAPGGITRGGTFSAPAGGITRGGTFASPGGITRGPAVAPGGITRGGTITKPKKKKKV